MTNQTNALSAAQSTLADAKAAISNFKRDLMTMKEKAFLSSGGCDHCWGSGSVVVWGTLDSMTGCYDEFGTCKKCNGKKQIWCGSNKHRRSGHPKVKVPALVETEAEISFLKVLEQAEREAEKELTKVQKAYAIVKGCTVEVVKGRKVKPGTKGKVFWFSPDGDCVGLKDDQDNAHFVKADYCVNLTPRTDEQIKADGEKSRIRMEVMNSCRKGAKIKTTKGEGKVKWCGRTKRGEGHWACLFTNKGSDVWVYADDIKTVNGRCMVTMKGEEM